MRKREFITMLNQGLSTLSDEDEVLLRVYEHERGVFYVEPTIAVVNVNLSSQSAYGLALGRPCDKRRVIYSDKIAILDEL